MARKKIAKKKPKVVGGLYGGGFITTSADFADEAPVYKAWTTLKAGSIEPVSPGIPPVYELTKNQQEYLSVLPKPILLRQAYNYREYTFIAPRFKNKMTIHFSCPYGYNQAAKNGCTTNIQLTDGSRWPIPNDPKQRNNHSVRINTMEELVERTGITLKCPYSIYSAKMNLVKV